MTRALTMIKLPMLVLFISWEGWKETDMIKEVKANLYLLFKKREYWFALFVMLIFCLICPRLSKIWERIYSISADRAIILF